MRRVTFTVMAAFLLLFMTGPAFAGDNLNDAASGIAAGISKKLHRLGDAASSAARKAGKEIGREAEIRKLLLKNYHVGKPFVIDSTFIDNKGIMKFIEPRSYRSYEGSDISKQEAVIRMLKTRQARMGDVFTSVEGIRAVDIEHPVFSQDGQFLGSVSMLVKHEQLLQAAAAPIEKKREVKCWVMQKDGLIIYETDPTQRGLNLFKDPLYKDYPELIALGKRIVREKQGAGFYSFVIHGTKNVVKKQAVWRTVSFFNNDWIVVAYKEIK